MAGNSQRRGAVRKSGKGATVGSGGQRRKGLEGKGPTPKAADREYHPAAKKARAAAKRGNSKPGYASGSRPAGGGGEKHKRGEEKKHKEKRSKNQLVEFSHKEAKKSISG